MNSEAGGQRLASFRLGNAHLAFEAGTISEVIRREQFTIVPNAQRQVLGILNVRGNLVTVLDLAYLLGLDPVESSDENRILLADTGSERVGFLVDGVGDIFEIESSSGDGLPANLTPALSAVSQAAYRTASDVVILLHLEAVLAESREHHRRWRGQAA